MSVIQIEVDDETLAEAMRLSNASTAQEVITSALREYVAQQRRAVVLEDLAPPARGWDHDGWRRRPEPSA